MCTNHSHSEHGTPRPALTSLVLAAGLAAAFATVTAPTAQAADNGVRMTFVKNHEHPDHSTLTVRVNGETIASYRAGSGIGASTEGRDSCRTDKGWLPNGTYRIEGHERHRDRTIKGFAIALSDKKCSDGTLRSDLFIHSEMTADGDQGSTEPTKWDGDQDYRSLGCIKLHPDHIKALFTKLDDRGWPTTLEVSG
ncbi:L,D-transpeptidase family protein [Kitasatospora sp. NPDC056446]|uniref:L,D-transpeptidase family protein n=1 Tax=Kitasatospora sp. NPDC056446 TaxID=3345819 RepID=UPI0036B06778